ncbi:c-type cytochrome [Rhodoligotrophos appendicifer]|uniref:c-type cytochrome n=1 Tax=Rhodoligotrophos appendicifer TaxID=987056 RepID=UPI001FEAD677|nr:cytochrome c [Rhodoligotrophos appendicifer]
MLAGVTAAQAETPSETPSIRRGRALVQLYCSSCHAIGLTGESPLAIAPKFRDLHKNYPVEDLSEALAEGIVTGHPSMPEFQLHPAEIIDVIGYLKTLEEP